jgi:SAM-dependent methyltransferase
MNWLAKALVQKSLSIVPGGGVLNDMLQDLRVSKKVRVQRLFEQKLLRARPVIDFYNSSGKKFENITMLEVGTGWVPTFPIILSLIGMKRIVTIDHVPHLDFGLALDSLELIESRLNDISFLSSVPTSLLEERLSLVNRGNLAGFLESLRIEYMAPEDISSLSLPSASFDLVFSNGVFEHVAESVLREASKEFYRVLKPTGDYINVIGLHDHFDKIDRNISRVNFLKFSERQWRFIAQNKISHINRLRLSEHLEIMQNVGFVNRVLQREVDEESLHILKNLAIDKKFRDFDKEDLATVLATIASQKSDHVDRQ